VFVPGRSFQPSLVVVGEELKNLSFETKRYIGGGEGEGGSVAQW
jgi:hypothetical protein